MLMIELQDWVQFQFFQLSTSPPNFELKDWVS